jgi:hypothetical protein
MRLNAGLRYDWQQSKWLGGCVPENQIVPDLLPGICQNATSSGLSPVTGQIEEIPAFSNWSPRVSLTYDLFGSGKTALKASASYYYQTKITLANALSELGGVTLSWGNNATSGACASATTSCWQDLNLDGFIQRNELSFINPAIGTAVPSSNNANFDLVTGLTTATGNTVSADAQLARTREATVGVSHELFANFAVGADFIYRKYDRGTNGYTIGFQPGAAGFPLSQIYTAALHTDAATGNTATYFHVINTGACPIASLQAPNDPATGAQRGCMRPSGLGTITITDLSYQVYKGVDLTLTKRFSNRWQMNMAATIQTRNDFNPEGSFVNPTGIDLAEGRSTLARYLFKLSGSYTLPWDITASGNLNINDGAVRTLSITGPGNVPGGFNAAGSATNCCNYTTLNFEPAGTRRFEKTTLLDIGIAKTFSFNGGRHRLKVNLDGFNVLNSSPVLGYSSNNISSAGTASNPIPPSQRISTVLPPRVFRVGSTFWF